MRSSVGVAVKPVVGAVIGPGRLAVDNIAETSVNKVSTAICYTICMTVASRCSWHLCQDNGWNCHAEKNKDVECPLVTLLFMTFIEVTVKICYCCHGATTH